MGLTLDSSVLVTAERQGKNARQMLSTISTKTGDTEIGFSVVTLIELAHGAARADALERKAKQRQFIEELQVALSVHLVKRRWRFAPEKSMARIRPEECGCHWLIC
jgi:predicted nucleic acid-binding protein